MRKTIFLWIICIQICTIFANIEGSSSEDAFLISWKNIGPKNIRQVEITDSSPKEKTKVIATYSEEDVASSSSFSGFVIPDSDSETVFPREFPIALYARHEPSSHVENFIREQTEKKFVEIQKTQPSKSREDVFAYLCADCFLLTCTVIPNRPISLSGVGGHLLKFVPLERQQIANLILTLSKNKVGQQLLLTFIAHYMKSADIPKIVFMHGLVLLARSVVDLRCGRFQMITIGTPGKVALMRSNGEIFTAEAAQDLFIFHEMLHLLHDLEDPSASVLRRERMFTGKFLFLGKDKNDIPVIELNKKLKKLLVQKTTADINLGRAITAFLATYLSNDEEIFTMFGLDLHKDGHFIYDPLCEAAYSASAYGYVRINHALLVKDFLFSNHALLQAHLKGSFSKK